jgi:hypothetical protein
VRVERGRPFIGVAAAKQTIASLLDPSNTAQLEQRFAAANTSAAAASNRNPRVAADADAADADKVLARLGSSSGECERADRDPSDCMAILRSFQVKSREW